MTRRRRLTRSLFWTAIGAATAYLCDPQNGRGRRARLNDQIGARVRDARQVAERKARYAQSTAEGKVRAFSRSGAPPADDRALVDRIKSEVLGGSRFEGHQVVVEAVDGVVTLRGEVADTQQVAELVASVDALPGVVSVVNLVHLPGEAPPNKDASVRASGQ